MQLAQTTRASSITKRVEPPQVKMSNSEKLVHYDDPGVEPPIPNEEELINDIISLIHRVQSHNFSMHRHGFRGTHVKTQGVVKGELTILPDLSDELAQGLCSPANQKLNGGKETWCLGTPMSRVSCRTTGRQGPEAVG
jgi:hypothetical protein